MTRKLTLCLTTLLVLAATSAQAFGPKCTVTAFSGTAVPTGDFSDKAKLDARTGFQVGGNVDLSLNSLFAVGLDGSWNQNKHGTEGETVNLTGGGTAVYDTDKFRTWQIGAHAKYMMPMPGPLGVFGLVGVGAYNTTQKLKGTVTPPSGPATAVDTDNSTDTRFGGKLGLGGDFKMTPMWGIGAEADYNFINEDKAKAGGSSNLQYVSVHGMVSLHLGL